MKNLIQKEIEIQLSMDTDLLLRMIGSSSSVGSTPATHRDGAVILKNTKRILKERICSDETILSIYNAQEDSKSQLSTAIVDCIAEFVTGVSPITIAVLIVKDGLDSLCGENNGE